MGIFVTKVLTHYYSPGKSNNKDYRKT